MKIEAKVFDARRDLHLTLTGEWPSVKAMRQELQDDGLYVLRFYIIST